MCLEFYHNHAGCQGTGSYPNPPPGRQRNIRRIPIIVPRATPYFSMAWRVYSLQVGINRHAARPPIKREIHTWYARTIDIATRRAKLFFCFFVCIKFFYIPQCLAHCDASVCTCCVQYCSACNKYIVQIRVHIFFIKSNPVAQQSL